MDEKSRLGRLKNEHREPVDEFEPWVLGAVGLGEPWGSILGTDFNINQKFSTLYSKMKLLSLFYSNKIFKCLNTKINDI